MRDIIDYIVSSIGHARDYFSENQDSLDRIELAYIRGRIETFEEILGIIEKKIKGGQ